MGSRISLPSLAGISPRSDFWIAFSMAPMAVTSQGEIRISRLSGTERLATWFSGVGTP